MQANAPLRISGESSSPAGRFAHAVGLHDVMFGTPALAAAEAGRTVRLTRIHDSAQIEPTAHSVARLLLPEPSQEDTRRTINYVLVELLRNVVQHSKDPLGGVVAAQVHARGRTAEHPVVQVAVADGGIGIPASLHGMHKDAADPQNALAKAMWPHISGTFAEGLTGTQQNAGMGLFFIAEMAKLAPGRLLIASRGAALQLTGDPEALGHHRQAPVDPSGTGFPGTLVVFELPADAVADCAALIETIKNRARERTPQRAVHRWIRYDPAPASALRLLVRVAVENTVEAESYAQKTLIPQLTQRKALQLDFGGIPMLTQSYLHALLYEPLRIAWALRTPIYVTNVMPAVKSNLELLENYALGG